MGRHSAQVEDETEDRSAVAVADVEAVEDAAPVGRHARREPDEASRKVPSSPATKIAPRPFGPGAPTVVEPVGVPVAEPGVAHPAQPAAEGSRPARGAQHATSADLALLRSNRRVLAAAAVAVIVPFAAYVVVLAGTDHLVVRTSLLWIWAPLVSAGLLLGLVLDVGHRRVAPPDPSAATNGVTEPSGRP